MSWENIDPRAARRVEHESESWEDDHAQLKTARTVLVTPRPGPDRHSLTSGRKEAAAVHAIRARNACVLSRAENHIGGGR